MLGYWPATRLASDAMAALGWVARVWRRKTASGAAQVSPLTTPAVSLTSTMPARDDADRSCLVLAGDEVHAVAEAVEIGECRLDARRGDGPADHLLRCEIQRRQVQALGGVGQGRVVVVVGFMQDLEAHGRHGKL